ncbi:hypothetical protein HZC30_05950 [Candidatus Woesearchaeota archaeon]|nr:hypothetical protein [Candidatus Woesearchaeota archaeon]
MKQSLSKEKKLVVSVIVIISILIILGVGLELNSAGLATKPLPATKEVRCTDSDGGINLMSKGSTTLGKTTQQDSCTKNKVVEYYCIREKINQITSDCPSGYSCSGGKCTLSATKTSFDKGIIAGKTIPEISLLDNSATLLPESTLFDLYYTPFVYHLPTKTIEYSGDGTYSVSKGTNITASNNVKMVITNIFLIDKTTPGYPIYVPMLVYDLYVKDKRLNLYPLAMSLTTQPLNLFGIKITLKEDIWTKISNQSDINISVESTIPEKISEAKFFYDFCMSKTQNNHTLCRGYCHFQACGEDKLYIQDNIYLITPPGDYDLKLIFSRVKDCYAKVSAFYSLDFPIKEIAIRISPGEPPASGEFGLEFPSISDKEGYGNNCSPLMAHEFTHYLTWPYFTAITGKLMEGMAQHTQFDDFDLGDWNLICGDKGWTYAGNIPADLITKKSCYTETINSCAGEVKSNGVSSIDAEEYNNKKDKDKLVILYLEKDEFSKTLIKLVNINYTAQEMSFEHRLLQTGGNKIITTVLEAFTLKLWEYKLGSNYFTAGSNYLVAVYPSKTDNGEDYLGVSLGKYVAQSCFEPKISYCNNYPEESDGYLDYYDFSGPANPNAWENFYNSGACFWREVGHENVKKLLDSMQETSIQGNVFDSSKKMKDLIGSMKYNSLLNKYHLNDTFSKATVLPFTVFPCYKDTTPD